jgi:ABC-2 type transport system permease protein
VINSGMASGMLLWIDRKNGMFEQILMGPFTRTQYIASLIISTIFAGLVSAGVVFVLALPVIAGATLTLAGFVYAGLTIVLGSLFFGSLAIILSIRVKSSESFQLLINFLFFLLVFTSSVFYPVEKAPSVIQVVSLINPLTYIVDIFRIGMFGLITPLFTLELIVLIAESFGMFALAIVMFRRLKV